MIPCVPYHNVLVRVLRVNEIHLKIVSIKHGERLLILIPYAREQSVLII